uniref:Uncharacterized protein n=1 Tax=Schlesneria paludicola TaxID=360056 RepID=A0A7C4LIT6_9PLAN
MNSRGGNSHKANGKVHAMGLFGGKDWNIIAVIFERKDLYRVNGNRGKGSDAVKARDGAKNHPRTIFWAVFDQKRMFLEGEVGLGHNMVPESVVQKLRRELHTNPTVVQVLSVLEKGELPMIAKPLLWSGYPKSETPEE